MNEPNEQTGEFADELADEVLNRVESGDGVFFASYLCKPQALELSA